ncbi:MULTISPECIES: cbb3-type cytochrome oxidase assembly protein CcoS [Bradyrhizobium]|uniref:cbb3-type cytochrome oxidase assembly protein CcoS n=1 Tax=Bradyrhizobium pachyrhizi TaxID=280333 RepID=UPI00040B35E2
MEVLVYLVPLALSLGFVGLLGFLWSLKSGQYDDLDGAAWRAITDDEPDEPSAPVQIVQMDQRFCGSGRQRCAGEY